MKRAESNLSFCVLNSGLVDMWNVFLFFSSPFEFCKNNWLNWKICFECYFTSFIQVRLRRLSWRGPEKIFSSLLNMVHSNNVYYKKKMYWWCDVSGPRRWHLVTWSNVTRGETVAIVFGGDRAGAVTAGMESKRRSAKVARESVLL